MLLWLALTIYQYWHSVLSLTISTFLQKEIQKGGVNFDFFVSIKPQ